MTDEMLEKVLDKLVKEKCDKTWEEYTKEENFKDYYGNEVTRSHYFKKETVKRAVELAFEAKQAEFLKKIDEEIVLHLNNAEATGEPFCVCMIENEGDCDTMDILKKLKKDFQTKAVK